MSKGSIAFLRLTAQSPFFIFPDFPQQTERFGRAKLFRHFVVQCKPSVTRGHGGTLDEDVFAVRRESAEKQGLF
jgi:hypothetical protein